MAFLAVALSVNFSACSDDDEDGGSSNNSGKKLSTIVNGNTFQYLLYDNQGRLTQAVTNMLSGYNFEYKKDSIICTNENGLPSNVYLLNSDGNIIASVSYGYSWSQSTGYQLIQSSISTSTYTYDANKQLTKIIERASDGTYTTELTWSDGCIVQVVTYTTTYSTTYTYTYNSTPSSRGITYYKGYVMYVLGYPELWLANAGYFGKLPAYLISEIHTVSGSGYEEIHEIITYEYDDDGYVSKLTNSWDGSLTLSWE